MLRNKGVRSDDWHTSYSKSVLDEVNINGDQAFTVVGVAPEPQNVWDDDNKRYTEEVNGFGVWVAQDVTIDHHRYCQNPIMVIVDTNKQPNVMFGQFVKFQGLLGYHSRRNHFSFRADGVQVLKES